MWLRQPLFGSGLVSLKLLWYGWDWDVISIQCSYYNKEDDEAPCPWKHSCGREAPPGCGGPEPRSLGVGELSSLYELSHCGSGQSLTGETCRENPRAERKCCCWLNRQSSSLCWCWSWATQTHPSVITCWLLIAHVVTASIPVVYASRHARLEFIPWNLVPHWCSQPPRSKDVFASRMRHVWPTCTQVSGM